MMKKLLLGLFLTTTSTFAAQNTIVLEDSFTLDAIVDEVKVACRLAGYNGEELRIEIAGLENVTVLDHGHKLGATPERIPFLSAGLCQNSFDPASKNGLLVSDVVQGNPRIETIVVNRQVMVAKFLDSEKTTCYRSIVEILKTEIGGVSFESLAQSEAEVLPSKFCQK